MLEKLATAYRVTTHILKGLWYGFVIATPLLGFWLASSLTAYLNGPVWLAALAGVLAFPVLPLLWELRGHLSHRKKVEASEDTDEEVGERLFTLNDRVVLRILVINLSLLTVLVGLFPQGSFAALSTRGDWMLTGQQSPTAETTRTVLFGAAGGLEWLYNLTRDNPYEAWADEDDDSAPDPVAGDVDRGQDDVDESDSRVVTPEPSGDEVSSANDQIDSDEGTQPVDLPGDKDTSEPDDHLAERAGDKPPRWPMHDDLHPAVAEMPASAETSPEAVARYIAAREADPFLRVKALYDWIADHIRYDAPALAAGEYPPQDPETVFETRKAVCAGYAKLLERMSQTIGIKMVYVTGVSRDRGGNVGGNGHAWNAVEIKGRWYLIDATWGAGYVEGGEFTRRYNPDYLFTPPEVMGVDHFPDDAKWQLREDPISRGEFMRQPMLSAGFFERGFRLLAPRRSQISARDHAVIKLDRPRDQHVLATINAKSAADGQRCDVSGDATVEVVCDVGRPGSYMVKLFGNETKTGTYEFIGQVQVNAR